MTPDLETRIRAAELTPARARKISEASRQLADGFRVWHAATLGFFRRTPFLEIPDLHDYRKVGRQELVALIDSNAVGTATVYQVRSSNLEGAR